MINQVQQDKKEGQPEPLVDAERYDAALNALKGIISEVRQLFKDEVLKPNGKTLDKLL